MSRSLYSVVMWCAACAGCSGSPIQSAEATEVSGLTAQCAAVGGQEGATPGTGDPRSPDDHATGNVFARLVCTMIGSQSTIEDRTVRH